MGPDVSVHDVVAMAIPHGFKNLSHVVTASSLTLLCCAVIDV